MAIQKSYGIVLRRQELRETSVILTFYTADFGKIKGVLRGVRGSRQQCAGAAHEVCALDEVVFYERKISDFFTVSQCDLVEFFSPVRASLERLAYAAYMAELTDSVTPADFTKLAFFNVSDNAGITVCEFHPWKLFSPTLGWEVVSYNEQPE